MTASGKAEATQCFKVESIARTVASTVGDRAAVEFNLEGAGEVSLGMSFEAIGETQMALAHLQQAMSTSRQALGAGESAGAFPAVAVKARDLPDGQLQLQINTDHGIPFRFRLSRQMAERLAEALNDWVK